MSDTPFLMSQDLDTLMDDLKRNDRRAWDKRRTVFEEFIRSVALERVQEMRDLLRTEEKVVLRTFLGELTLRNCRKGTGLVFLEFAPQFKTAAEIKSICDYVIPGAEVIVSWSATPQFDIRSDATALFNKIATFCESVPIRFSEGRYQTFLPWYDIVLEFIWEDLRLPGGDTVNYVTITNVIDRSARWWSYIGLK